MPPKDQKPSILGILKRKISKYHRLISYSFLVLLSSLTLIFLYSFTKPLFNFAKTFLSGPKSIISFTEDPIDNLKSTNDRTNILLLGMGGAGHEGALLTDSIMVISYHHQQKDLSLLSIPRDLWVDSMKAKINTAYFYGEEKQKGGGGLILAKSVVSEVTGLPIHYGFALSFEGFKEAIDTVGGIDVYIDTSFDDYKYPIPGMENAYPLELRYEHLSFKAGLEHMDGDRALKFTRSRNADGDEGTDFARSKRQQKIILAFKDKVLSTNTLLNPQKIDELIDLYRQHIDTDILEEEYASFAKVILLADKNSLNSVNLTTGDDSQLGILEHPTNTSLYQGQYVLIPKDNNGQALKQYIENELTKKPTN